MKPLNELRKTQRQLSKMTACDKYYSVLDSFKARLQRFMNDNFLMDSLTRTDLIDLLDWCGKYRPIEPFVVLGRISSMNERLKVSQRKNAARSNLRRKEREKRSAEEKPTAE